MKINISVKLTNDISADLAARIAQHITHPEHLVVTSEVRTDLPAGQEADFTATLGENPYLVQLLRADKINVARILEDVAGQLRRALHNAQLGVDTIYIQANPQHTNAHSDTVYLTL